MAWQANEGFVNGNPIMMLHAPSSSDWVLRKVMEVNKHLEISYKGLENKVQALFREIECCKS